MKKTNMKRFTLLALFIAIEIAVSVIPFLGYINLGFINATTLHIPVIIAGILLGKKEGAIVGLVFGLTSLIKASIDPNISSFVFSPFITIGGQSGNFVSLLIAIVPRVLVGFVAGLVYEQLSKRNATDILSMSVAALLGSLTNTILVLGGIYIFFGPAYASVVGIAYDALIGFIMSIITGSGIMEAIAAVIIAVAVCKAGKKVVSL
ncbi:MULTISPECIES: ECF transporter S component [unclassified Breznakia]|uniref:ECF transporter S component n=1 Tax=unclassified Breznakia TaxID=2623764 RepID=UPI002475EDD7|nr:MULTISPECIES: ECF transporter S component [unclassified Breznakia]MDH6366196.1 putative membrane protein [Breznakia sp. PH1-1]MDH6403289.1 putative membrane protein [Breznakia sp. PF1-11]MDH6410998.1 putative membrane protein [Breznakia sp. PFB1-11]MDH6413362.1 putative membrane protein [Breznakia sp. PFB1-14]MDH6416127.1 putative membrane protein [Breznakia sp. PFB1-4]